MNFVYPSRFTSLAALATTFHFDRITVQGSLLYTFVDDSARESGAAAANRHVLTPTVVAQYRPLRGVDLALRAFYKRIFPHCGRRAPRVFERLIRPPSCGTAGTPP